MRKLVVINRTSRSNTISSNGKRSYETNAELTAPAQLKRYDIKKAQSTDASAIMPLVDVSFAFDGNALVFESSNGSNQDIFVMLLPGDSPIRLTDDESVDFDPDWQP